MVRVLTLRLYIEAGARDGREGLNCEPDKQSEGFKDSDDNLLAMVKELVHEGMCAVSSSRMRKATR